MTKILYLLFTIFLIGSLTVAAGFRADNPYPDQLTEELQALADSVNGDVGIAVISGDGDTVTVNNDKRYPLMSVFKLHQTIATLLNIEHTGISLDSIVSINRNDLNHSTWSPMLQDYTGDSISISYRDLFQYALTVSDNNASNYLFENLLNVRAVDSILCRIIPREQFRIDYSEAEMQNQHSKAFDNFTSPLGAASLINKLYTDSLLLSTEHSDFIRNCLEECKTGSDRIMLPLSNIPDLKIGHKTGSGYRDNGILIAHNDVAFIKLPNNTHYALAVFIKNFVGTEHEASELIARISSIVYHSIDEKNSHK